MTLILAVVNLKGGAGKTTTAGYAAHALHELGRRVLAIDADQQGSLFEWHKATAFPFPCTPYPSGRLHADLAGFQGLADAVVIDTPGTEHGRGIALSALLAATHVLIPCAPTPVEFERLRDLRPLLDQAVNLGAEFEHGVLLTRAVTGASSTQVYRDVMTGDGWRVLRPVVARLERFAQAVGEPVVRAAQTGYGDAVIELAAL